MNILFLSGHYPPHTKGGGEISTHLIAQGLVKLGQAVTVIAEGERKEIGELDGVRVWRLPIPLTKKVLFEKRASQKMANYLREELKDVSSYDVVHAHDWRSALVLHELSNQLLQPQNLSAGRQSVKMIVTARDYAQIAGDTNHMLADGTIPSEPFALKSILRSHRIAEASGPRKIIRALQYLTNIDYRREAFAAFLKQIFISHAQRKEIAKHQDFKNQETQVIYNPIAPTYFSERLENGAAEHLLYIGRVETYKGVGLLIAAWQQIAKEHRNARLTIIGDGAERRRYEQQIARSGLQYRTEFKHHVSYDRILAEYDAASIVVAPHLWIEPFGRTVVEAMARGKVVVAANVGGPAEIIQDHVTGLLFERGSRKALTQRLSDALTMDKYDRRGIQTAARGWVQDNLTIEKIAKQHEVFYTEYIVPMSSASPRALEWRRKPAQG